MSVRRALLAAACAAGMALVFGAAQAATIRIAEHRQSNIDALKSVAPEIAQKLGLTIEVIEYPAPEKDYLTKLLTELRAGNAPDLFSAPRDQDVADMVAAGYLAPMTTEIKGSEAYGKFFNVVKSFIFSANGEMYTMPRSLQVNQLYFRRDVLEKAGISTEQPKTWAELLDRAREIKAKTGAYGLMFPAGLTWGGGAFGEGFQHLLVGSKTPQIVGDDGKLLLGGEGVRDAFQFYKDLIDNDLMPIDPLLGPEPWVIPKYEMFPAGKLVATTCGSWCYIYDWGPKSKNPIADIENTVGTWAVPGQTGGLYVIVGASSWAVNAKAADLDLAKKVFVELASVKAEVAYTLTNGGIPPRQDAIDNPEFLKLTPLIPIFKNVENGTFLRTTTGFSAVSEGVARATEALLRKETDAAGAQKILVDYAKGILGEDAVR